MQGNCSEAEPPPDSWNLTEALPRGACAVLVQRNFLDLPTGHKHAWLDSLYIAASQSEDAKDSLLVRQVRPSRHGCQSVPMLCHCRHACDGRAATTRTCMHICMPAPIQQPLSQRCQDGRAPAVPCCAVSGRHACCDTDPRARMHRSQTPGSVSVLATGLVFWLCVASFPAFRDEQVGTVEGRAHHCLEHWRMLLSS